MKTLGGQPTAVLLDPAHSSSYHREREVELGTVPQVQGPQLLLVWAGHGADELLDVPGQELGVGVLWEQPGKNRMHSQGTYGHLRAACCGQ